jgi:hypothetical protein
MSKRQHKQAVAAVSDPLMNASILKQVFAFLPGNWLFLCAVCREWMAVYADMGNQQECRIDLYQRNKLVTYDSRTTLYRAAVASPETLRLARTCGLQIHTNYRLQVIAGLHADVQTLAALDELGMLLNYTVIDASALSGRLSILQHLVLLDEKYPPPDEVARYAASSGSVSMLKWLKTQSWCTFDEYACERAAQGGQLAALQYLRSVGCEWDQKVVASHAARNGSIAMAECLWQQGGTDIDAIIMAAAASEGRIAICKLLRSLGCDWTVDATTQAATSGDIKTLRWLRENDCPWDVRAVCMQAVRNGSTDMLDFIIEQGEVLDAELLTIELRAVNWGDELVAQWLKQHGA